MLRLSFPAPCFISIPEETCLMANETHSSTLKRVRTRLFTFRNKRIRAMSRCHVIRFVVDFKGDFLSPQFTSILLLKTDKSLRQHLLQKYFLNFKLLFIVINCS